MFFAGATLLAVRLSFGPVVQRGGWPVQLYGLYRLLYQHVPGFDGLRVPARMAMPAGLFLSVLAGIGADELWRRTRRGAVLVLLGVLFLVEADAAPLPVYRLDPPPTIYDAVRRLSRDA